ncbi:hypothetical protein AB9F39_36785, partial [Rhizobium leguminosarum]|uniref:hypothetical protein n=1 Tax=Rhizobium leguminosarum TaxID=384 RepID=UPI003F9648A1
LVDRQLKGIHDAEFDAEEFLGDKEASIEQQFLPPAEIAKLLDDRLERDLAQIGRAEGLIVKSSDIIDAMNDLNDYLVESFPQRVGN